MASCRRSKGGRSSESRLEARFRAVERSASGDCEAPEQLRMANIEIDVTAAETSLHRSSPGGLPGGEYQVGVLQPGIVVVPRGSMTARLPCPELCAKCGEPRGALWAGRLPGDVDRDASSSAW